MSKSNPAYTHPCSVAGCDQLVGRKGAHGWCARHYACWRSHGDPLHPIRQVRKRGAICEIEDCDHPHVAFGLCGMHRQRLEKYGDVDRGRQYLNGRPGTITAQGYRAFRIGGRKGVLVLEHRQVMERHIGRSLLPGESVHHRNGQRADNRLENLELWSTVQPSGQRVADKVKWAIEVLKLYAPEQLATM